MRTILKHIGTLLVALGFLVATTALLAPGGSSTIPPASVTQSDSVPPASVTQSDSVPPASVTQSDSVPPPPTPAGGLSLPTAGAPVPTLSPEARLPITRLVAPSIGLDVEVVSAPLVDSDGQRTWQVPAFKAGHAENTAGAGQVGNAVLMGHISSIHSGDVFKDLNRIQVGDEIDVFSGDRSFTYDVYETRSIPRNDLEMVEPTSEPVISLFTCTGTWDPVIWDFTERLFVRARRLG